MVMSLKEYFAAEGSRFTKKDAAIIGPCLQELAEQGTMTAEDVVSVARSTNSPLHGYFEWDDPTAAHLYRTEQARNMIRSIKVRVIDDGREIERRAFQVQSANKRGGELGAYRSVTLSETSEGQFTETSADALAELVSWSRRYSAYSSVWKDFAAAFGEVIGLMQKLPATGADRLEIAAGLSELFDWRVKYEALTARGATLGDAMTPLFPAIEKAQATLRKIKESNARDYLNSMDPNEKLPQAVRRRCEKCDTMFSTEYVTQILCPSCDPVAAANKEVAL